MSAAVQLPRRMGNKIAFTTMADDVNAVSKRFALNDEGRIDVSTVAQIYCGQARRVVVADLYGLRDAILGLRRNEALMFGVARKAAVSVVTEKEKAGHPDAIARTTEHLRFAKGAGLLFIDGDRDGFGDAPIHTAADFRAKLIEICPALAEGPMLVTSSASSYIWNTATGEWVTRAGGFHAYIPVKDARDIPRAGKALFERCWLGGTGFMKISKNGSLLPRAFIDASVFQPNRLSFEAGALCLPPLEQRRPAPRIFGDASGMFDSRAIADLRTAERARCAELVRQAREASSAEAGRIRGVYIGERAVGEAARTGEPVSQVTARLERALTTQALPNEFIVQFSDGSTATVGQMLADPRRYNGMRCRDPLEPEYDDDPRIAIACMDAGDGPAIYSHAHGEHRYRLGDPLPEWRTKLRVEGKQGTVIRDEENIRLVLEHDPELAGLAMYDEFANELVIMRAVPGTNSAGEYPRAWRDDDATHVQEYLQRSVMSKVAIDKVQRAIAAHAMTAGRFNPAMQRLDSVVWDGVKRLDDWLIVYLGAHDAERDYLRAVGAAFLISAVARIRKPGCKADCALVLEGAQGIKKSTVACVLAREERWFTDSLPPDLGSKDSKLHLQGNAIVELPELSQIRRTDVETVKAFMSRRCDKFRPPYGRVEVDFPRTCVFIGSTNDDAYLADRTGNRRFWPVKVGEVDIDALRADVDQLYAEADSRFKAGEKWYLDDDVARLAAAEALERVASDPWVKDVAKHVTNDGVPLPANLKFYPGEVLEWMSVPTNERHAANAKRLTPSGWVGSCAILEWCAASATALWASSTHGRRRALPGAGRPRRGAGRRCEA